MFDRIRFEIKPKSVHVTVDPFFVNDYVLYHEKDDEIHLLERDMGGFEITEDMSIYDSNKNIQYGINRVGDHFVVAVEEMSLESLLELGLAREPLDQIILLKKKILIPRS